MGDSSLIVDKTVQILVDDYDRQDGNLSNIQVERVLEKRCLDASQCVAVYEELERLGISIIEESEVQEKAIPDVLWDLGTDTSDSSPSATVIDQLFAHVRNVKLLRPEEEVELGRRISLGKRAIEELHSGSSAHERLTAIVEAGNRARDRMILANLRLVLHNAKHYVTISELNLDDLVQEGMFGLMKAVEKFDHNLGYRFSTYATWWIRQSITRALSDRGLMIRLPAHVFLTVFQLKRAYKLFAQTRPERPPTVKELADALVWTIDKVHFIQQLASLVPTSLDRTLPGHDDLMLIDTLVSEQNSPEQETEKLELAREIGKLLANLKESEREVLTMRFGLDGSGDGMTLDQIGRLKGVTRERIRQIESSALKRIRYRMKAADYGNGIKAYAPESMARPEKPILE